MAAPPLVRQLRGALIAGTTNAISRAVRRSLEDLPNTLNIMAQAFEQRALPRGQLTNVNMAIAQQAQAAVVSGWRSRLPRGNSGGALSGTLGNALASDAMTAGTSDRVISFVNPAVLSQSAKHWYRINYGAAGPNMAGGEEPQVFTVKLNNRPFVVLRDDAPPAPLSWLPRVFTWSPEGRMIVIRGPAEPRGKGSRAARFIDLGMEVVSREFGPAYDQFLREWVQDAAHRARLARKGINVPANVHLDSYGWHVEVG